MALFGTPPSLTELIGRAKAGDEEAQWTLFEMYAPRVYGYVRYQLKTNSCVQPPEDSKDVAISILWKALDPKKLETLDNPEAFPGWLFTTTKRDVIAHLRQCTRNPTVNLEDHDFSEPVSQIRSSEETVEASELIQQILMRARTIDKRLYVILVLQLLGYEDHEICKHLEISSSNIRTIRSRGLLKLKALMTETKE